jgi:moderate conductance mechanosensitive channel
VGGYYRGRMLMAPPGDDSGLIDACGRDPGAVCEAVWDATESEGWAKVADWFIGKPLTILIILVVAFVVARVARRAVRKGVRRLVMTQRVAGTWALERVGIATPTTGTITDPRREGRATSIATVVASSVTVLVWTIATIIVLGELNVDLAPLIAATGIAGVALGFGAQSLVKDCITGLFMLIEDQYGIGDEVDLGEAVGTVEQITLRTTVLRSPDGTVWHVPNGEVVRVGNRSQLWAVALIDVAIGVDADVERASQVLQDAANRVSANETIALDVLEPPELLGVENITATGVTLRLRIRTKPGAQHRIQRALREAIKQALDEEGIALAQPVPVPPPPPAPPA